MDLKAQLLAAKKLLAGYEIITLPKEIIELQKYLREVELPDLQVLETIVSSNTVLVGELIRAANVPSVQGRHPRKIETVFEALDMLGARRIKNLATALALKLAMENTGQRQLMKHSLQVAEAAMVIADKTGRISVDKAYLIALFHNVGCLMMAKIDRHYMEFFIKALSKPYSTLALEMSRYQTTHEMVGFIVAQEWKLEDEFKKIILLHHNERIDSIKDQAVAQGVALVQLANVLVAELFYKIYITSEFKRMFQFSAKALGITQDETIAMIRKEILTAVQKNPF